MNCAMPTGSVREASVRVAISGQKKLFHVERNVTIATAVSAGLASGSTTDHQMRSVLAPSTRAAAVRVAISGQKELVHVERNVTIATAVSAGLASGSTTDHQMRSVLAPSTRAASSSS